VRLVIADTGPVNYLVLIQHIDLLPTLFRKVALPSAVQRELEDWYTPPSVRDWMTNRAAWVEVSDPPDRYLDDESLKGLDQAEQAAIALAVAINADIVLMDDRKGVMVARSKGFAVIGTLGVRTLGDLNLAARRGLIDLADSFARLKRTNFRYRQEILDALLDELARGDA
jgi:predicted nucleic acid-binding protein